MIDVEQTGSIYIIRNTINDKVYIGQTTMTVMERFKNHLKPSTCKQRSTYKLYNAMNKYGKENFYVETLESNIPVGELVVGDNTLKIEVTTVDQTDVEMVNKFLYKIDLEDNDNLRKTVTKTRDYKTYTDGFEMNSLEISGNQVINSNKFVSEKNVTSVTIPENTISISIKEV